MTVERSIFRFVPAALVVVGGLLAVPQAAAQDSIRVGPDGEPIKARSSRLTLGGAADRSLADLKSIGYFRNSTCADNLRGGMGCFGSFNIIPRTGSSNTSFFDDEFQWGVPKTTWDSAVAKVPSLANAIGGGWTVSNRLQAGGGDMAAADGGLGTHHAGATSTADRSCLDHSNTFGAGTALLAVSDCEATWGVEPGARVRAKSDPTRGWDGRRPIPIDAWLTRYNANPAAFNFDFWRVSEAEIDAAGVPEFKPIGAIQTYGYTSDYTTEILCGTSTLRNFAHIIPATSPAVPGGCVGSDPARRRHGWPLGIEIRFDAFMFQLPALKEISYFQMTLTNHSRQVYGVPLDYDSLYIAYNHPWFNDQQRTIVTWVPELGATVGHASPIRPCDAARAVVDLTCSAWGAFATSGDGFNGGATALIWLKTPIGDLRNKLFTNPASPFYNPAHPLAGDTLTFNQGKLCGFRACARNTTATNPDVTPDHERRNFGMISATEVNALGTRSVTDPLFTDQIYWHTFRNPGFPTRWTPGQSVAVGGGFHKYLPPGGWDYNKDGVPDSLLVDGCWINGCVGMWGDTLANGKYATYSNTQGTTGVGPIRLMADSTVSWVFAQVPAVDSASLMTEMRAAVDNYMNFYLAPDPAPKCAVVGATRPPTSDGSAITINWDNACFAGQWTDKFLAKQAGDMAAADTSSPLGRLRMFNPWLLDTLVFLSSNNLQNLYLFKSCTSGNDWTDDGDCEGDVATGGPLGDGGWLPLQTYPSDNPAGIPNTYTDVGVLPGLTFTYSLVGQTRGANFTVLNGDGWTVGGAGDTLCNQNCRLEPLNLAPSLFNAITASTAEPSVARVYLPLSRQAGGVQSRVVLVDSIGPMTAGRIAINITADSLRGGTHRVVIGDATTAVRTDSISRATGVTRSVATRVILQRGAAADTIDGTNVGGFTAEGAAAPVTAFTIVGTDSVVTTTYTWAAGPVMALTREGAGGGALLLSSTLTGSAATPVAFKRNLDYPRFELVLDASLANVFNRQQHLRDSSAGAAVIPGLVEPTVTWINGSALQDQVTSNNTANGDYRITFGAAPYGSGEPFRLNFSSPGTSVSDITTSLTNRPAITTGLITAAAASAIATSIGQPAFTTDSLVAVRLPFRIRNLRYNRDVQVAMRKRSAAGKFLVMGLLPDTIHVRAPDDVWAPGDTLFFLEQVGANLVVTFRRAVVGCDLSRFTRLECNPVYPGTRGGSTYLGQTPGQVLLVQYHTPVTSVTEFTYRADAPARGLALADSVGAIRAGLLQIRAVPNPYVMISQYAGNGLMFTHLPPRGYIRVYTVAGQFVQQIRWDESNLGADGDLLWNLRTREGNLLGSGLYLYVVTATQDSPLANASAARPIASRTAKFVIIR